MTEPRSLGALDGREKHGGDNKLTIQGRAPRMIPRLGDKTAATWQHRRSAV